MGFATSISIRGPMRIRRAVAVGLTAPWVLWALVRTFGLDVRHPLVAMMAFTPYAALTSPAPVLAAVALRRWVVAVVAAIAALALTLAVVPRAVTGPRGAPDSSDPGIVVMTANLWGGRADPRAVLRLAREHQVDVLSLQELTPEELRRLDAAGARRLFHGRAVEPRPGAAGSGVLARDRVRRTDPPDPTGAAQPEATLPGGLRVKAVHPNPPVSESAERDWRAELRTLPGPRHRILAGDFNGTLDHREIRRLLDRGYADAADAVGAGLHATWPVRGRRRPGIAIDHVLIPPGFAVASVTIAEVPGSDHRAVIARLVER